MKWSLHNNKNYFHVSFRVKDINGRVIQKQKSTGIKYDERNRKKAERKALEIIKEYEGVNVLSENILLCDYIADWIERDKIRIQSTTYDGYKHMLNKHIYPYFNETRLKVVNVKPIHLEEYCRHKIEAGLSSNTVIKHIAVIRTALQDAVKNSVIRSNPADLVEKPKRVKPNSNYYKSEELCKLLAISKNTNIELPIYLAIIFGLRRSEIVGLKWSAINFDDMTLSIQEKVVRKKQNGKIIEIASDTMKTDSSKRMFLMNDDVCEYLKEVKEKQKNLIRSTNEFIDYVCVNEIGERLKVDYVTHSFKKLLAKHDMQHIRFHELRHSCCTLLKDNGVSIKDIQAYAGHADYRTTANMYTHTDQKNKLNSLNIITEIIR